MKRKDIGVVGIGWGERERGGFDKGEVRNAGLHWDYILWEEVSRGWFLFDSLRKR